MRADTQVGTQYGLGQHIEGQPTEWRKPYAIATIASSLSYSISAMFVKLSLLSFYLRLRYTHFTSLQKCNSNQKKVENLSFATSPTPSFLYRPRSVSPVSWQQHFSVSRSPCCGIQLNPDTASTSMLFTSLTQRCISSLKCSSMLCLCTHFGISIYH